MAGRSGATATGSRPDEERFVLAATNSKALWYLTRGTGMVSLVLLTLTVALGVAEVARYASPRWPRFVLAAIHKNASLLAVSFLAIHILTAVADSFAPIHLVDIFIPFVGSYRAIWLGLGTVAFDLLIALVITSLARERIGYRAWRVVHWAAYACWPVALMHGLGTGSDTRVRWAAFVNVACIVMVVAAVWWRIASTRTVTVARRAFATFASAAIALGVIVFMLVEPMRPGWASKAGTPTALFSAARTPAAATGDQISIPFSSATRGTIAETGPDNSGRSTVKLNLSLPEAGGGRLNVVIRGAPLADGGVDMRDSSVRLGTASAPDLYRGQIVSLNGTNIVADVHNSGGATLTIRMQLVVDEGSHTVGGTVTARQGVSPRGN
jgi:hypothetical protein